MITYDVFSYYAVAVLLMGNGLFELMRLWDYKKRGSKRLHWMYELELAIIELTRDKKAADSRKQELLANWWKYHGTFRNYLLWTIFLGIVMMIVGPFLL